MWQTACDRLAERLTDAAGDWMTCVTGLVVVMLVNRTDWCILTGARRCTLTASCRWYGRSDSSWMSELKCVCLIQLIGSTAWLFNCIVFDCSVWLIEYTGTAWLNDNNDHDWLMLWIKLWLVRSYSYVNGESFYNLLDGQVHMNYIYVAHGFDKKWLLIFEYLWYPNTFGFGIPLSEYLWFRIPLGGIHT